MESAMSGDQTMHILPGKIHWAVDPGKTTSIRLAPPGTVSIVGVAHTCNHVLGHGADDPLLRLMRERDDALALAQRSVEHGEAALEEQRIAQARAYIAEGRVRELEQRLAAEETKDDPKTDVDRVIDQLDKRLVPEPDRYRLRRHLDKAEEPDRSRAGQDRALGGAIGRKPTTYGLRVP